MAIQCHRLAARNLHNERNVRHAVLAVLTMNRNPGAQKNQSFPDSVRKQPPKIPISAYTGSLLAIAPTLLAAASALLARLDQITTEEFSKGLERAERESLRAVIVEANGEPGYSATWQQWAARNDPRRFAERPQDIRARVTHIDAS